MPIGDDLSAKPGQQYRNRSIRCKCGIAINNGNHCQVCNPKPKSKYIPSIKGAHRTVTRVSEQSQGMKARLKRDNIPVWFCESCQTVSQIETADYELGDSEPCVLCPDGVARVVTTRVANDKIRRSRRKQQQK